MSKKCLKWWNEVNMVYLVTWDLNKEKSNYASARTAFLAHLNRYGNIKDSGLDSVRFVSTNWSANQVSNIPWESAYCYVAKGILCDFVLFIKQDMHYRAFTPPYTPSLTKIC